MDTPSPHRKRNKKYNVPGHAHFLTFSCYQRFALLTNDLWRTWLAASIRAKCDQAPDRFVGDVFMPEHVHLLLKPRVEEYNLAARQAILRAKDNRAPDPRQVCVAVALVQFWLAGSGKTQRTVSRRRMG